MKKIVSFLVLISTPYILTMTDKNEAWHCSTFKPRLLLLEQVLSSKMSDTMILNASIPVIQNRQYHPLQLPFIEKLNRGENIDIDVDAQVLRNINCDGSEAMIQQEINYLNHLDKNLK